MVENTYVQQGHLMAVRFGTVTSTRDIEGGDRVMVQIKTDEKEEWAFPLLPKMLYIKPKVGEEVFILSSSNNNFYVGPIIAQKKFDIENCSAGTYSKFIVGGEVIPDAESNNWNGFAKDDEIAIEGRKHSSIILRDNDVILSSGLRNTVDSNDEIKDSRFKVNDRGDESFIDLKYDEEKVIDEEDTNDFRSTATIHADKIFLVGKNSKYDRWDPSVRFVNAKTGEILGREQEGNTVCDNMADLNEATSPLPYGDKLIEFLDLFREAFREHVHRLKTPLLENEKASVRKLLDYDLNKLLSDNVKIN